MIDKITAGAGGQLPLGITLRPSFSFASFFAGENRLAIELLQACAARRGEMQVYVYGRAAVGKSHLLQAACRASGEAGKQSAYLPLQAFTEQPEIVQDLASLDLVCLDQLDAIAGKPTWETALFNLINASRAARVPLLLAARHAPARLGMQLPDLISRLGWGPVLKLEPLPETQLRDALHERCHSLGLTIAPAALDYLLTRAPRDVAALFALLDRLDQLSLAEQRRLTIPFIKQYLEQP